ncbi:MAG: helix-turn-helix transcriptional regulator [Bryobacteraceae bacterium]
MNLTYPTAIILQAIEQGYRHGFDIMDVTGLPSGTVYPAVRRLEKEGLIVSQWESDEDAFANNRPARCYYEMNEFGADFLAECRARFRALPKLRPSQVRRSNA